MTQPFHFPDGRVANNAQDLLELCEQYPDDATGFLLRQDLEKWLAYIGSYDLAECAANARQIEMSDRQKLEDFLHKCHSLIAPKPVPEAVVETNIADNLTAPESASNAPETPQAAVEEATQAEQIVDSAPTKPESSVGKTPVTPPVETSASPQKAAAKAPATADSTNSQEKPSFFQVVAKFILRILERDKA